MVLPWVCCATIPEQMCFPGFSGNLGQLSVWVTLIFLLCPQRPPMGRAERELGRGVAGWLTMAPLAFCGIPPFRAVPEDPLFSSYFVNNDREEAHTLCSGTSVSRSLIQKNKVWLGSNVPFSTVNRRCRPRDLLSPEYLCNYNEDVLLVIFNSLCGT